ncbi:hypothetical protein [Streptomyces noursei]|uniref:Uncharacterized protein n=1 Tax=Streptomyces noursei TaxID=1971 RepID=A0A059VZF7_STRNR|nr:hypothetical protein [Streptomyces noursei]AIA02770.1 hypothetical protein DC74_2260 [Streptomyces noursei]UWS71578.1 hypothetical protein N1H47_10165 [Streptomyces noursei]GCB90409.1 hypothetical protein SALB_03113 [Streptomyces noursei]
MSRRVSLPGADELFRTTGGVGLQPSAPRRTNGGAATGGDDARVPAPAGEPTPASDASEEAPAARRLRAGDGPDGGAPSAGDGAVGAARSAPAAAPAEHAGRESEAEAAAGHRTSGGRAARAEREAAASAPAGASGRRRGRGANRRPSGRERHDEKITVYVSAEELMDLEHARLVLRGEHGLAVDRGRIVREAVAVVLADLESRGDASILVRRLRGR